MPPNCSVLLCYEKIEVKYLKTALKYNTWVNVLSHFQPLLYKWVFNISYYRVLNCIHLLFLKWRLDMREQACNNKWCLWIVADCCKWFCLCESLYSGWSLIWTIRTDKMFPKKEATKGWLLDWQVSEKEREGVCKAVTL